MRYMDRCSCHSSTNQSVSYSWSRLYSAVTYDQKTFAPELQHHMSRLDYSLSGQHTCNIFSVCPLSIVFVEPWPSGTALAWHVGGAGFKFPQGQIFQKRLYTKDLINTSLPTMYTLICEELKEVRTLTTRLSSC